MKTSIAFIRVFFILSIVLLQADASLSEETVLKALTFASQWPYHSYKGIAMDDSRGLVFLGDFDRIDILDTDLNNLSSMTVPWTEVGISALFYNSSDHYLYIAVKDYALRIMNVSDPEKPYIRGHYSTIDASYLNTGGVDSVFVEGDRAYLACGWDGFIIMSQILSSQKS